MAEAAAPPLVPCTCTCTPAELALLGLPVNSTTENERECSICHELFKEPKLLPCAHVLCRDCLLSWLLTNQEGVCPLCRCPVVSEVTVTGPAEWKTVVDALPDDVIMSALVESARVLNMDHTCVGCHQLPAVSICLDCTEMMCQACENVHTNFGMSRHHKFESLSLMSVERLASSQPVYCTAHPGKAAELFCPAHNAVICHVCASAKHRSCSDVAEVTDVAYKSRRELTAIVEKLEAGEISLEKVVPKLDSLLEEVEKNYDKSMADIDAKCDDMERSVKVCRQRMKDKALEAKLKSTDSILTAKARVACQWGMLASHRCWSDRVSKASTPASMTVATALLKQRSGNLDLSTKMSSLMKDVVQMTVTIDAAVVTEMKKKLEGLGTVESIHSHLGFDRWHFHTNRGKEVYLSNEGFTALRSDSGNDGIVVSSRPMKVNMVYEVSLDKVVGANNLFPCGVTLQAPDTLTLCSSAVNGWDSAVVVCGGVYKQGQEVTSNIEQDINYNLKQGQRVGVLLDDNNALYLYIDGADEGVIVDNIAQPCYPFFELRACYRRMTALPARPISRPLTSRSQVASGDYVASKVL